MAVHDEADRILRRLDFATDTVESRLAERLMVAQDCWYRGLVTDEEYADWRQSILVDEGVQKPLDHRRENLHLFGFFTHYSFL